MFVDKKKYKGSFFILFLSFGLSLNAQKNMNELGIFLGSTGLIGDIGYTGFFSTGAFSAGALYKYNFNPRYAVMGSINYSGLRAKDAWSDNKAIRERNFEMSTYFVEALAGVDFNFLEYKFWKSQSHTPTLILEGGLAFQSGRAPRYDSRFENAAQFYFGKYMKNVLKVFPIIGFGASYKYKISEKLNLAARMSWRYTFSDNFDWSAPKNSDYFAPYVEESAKFVGNKYNDWYFSFGLTLTYSFGLGECNCEDMFNLRYQRAIVRENFRQSKIYRKQNEKLNKKLDKQRKKVQK